MRTPGTGRPWTRPPRSPGWPPSTTGRSVSATLGRPAGFLERQVPRWLDQLASYDRVPEYRGNRLPHVAELADWLRAHLPEQSRPGLAHGDYHLDNVLLDPVTPRVAAVVDWEMCTVGDPLLDLGWLLVTWPDGRTGESMTGRRFAELVGLPGPDELVDAYARHSDRDVSGIEWYTVLAGFKLTIVIEGTYARSLAAWPAPADTRRTPGLPLRESRRPAWR